MSVCRLTSLNEASYRLVIMVMGKEINIANRLYTRLYTSVPTTVVGGGL